MFARQNSSKMTRGQIATKLFCDWMGGSHLISNFLLISTTTVTLGQCHGKVNQYIFPDLYFLSPKYVMHIGFNVRSKSHGSGGTENTWWCHQMETFSALLTICVGNSPVPGEFPAQRPGEFPAQRPVTRSFEVFFDLCLNKQLSKQLWGWWFEMPSCPLWRHSNDKVTIDGGGLIPSYCINMTPATMTLTLQEKQVLVLHKFKSKINSFIVSTPSHQSGWAILIRRKDFKSICAISSIHIYYVS